MEAKFFQTKQRLKIDIAAHILMIFLCACFAIYFKGFLAYVSMAITIIVADFIYYTDYHGKIIADENGITIIKTFLGIKVGKKFIEYSKIQGTDCGVNTVWGGMRTTRYIMEFALKMRDGSKIVLCNTMNIGASFPATEPEKYKKYLSEQPFMKISHYIDSKLHLNTSA